MARTINAKQITSFDRSVIELCKKISDALKDLIVGTANKKDFYNTYGKVSFTRDAGSGRGGGKLQRDALCTRGTTGKFPISNRNLRWNPLVVSNEEVCYAKKASALRVDGKKIIVDIVDGGKTKSYDADNYFTLAGRYTVTSEMWDQFADLFKDWTDSDWGNNSFFIRAFEACEWYDAVETFCVLGIAVASEIYNADFMKCYSVVTNILSKQMVDPKIKLPTKRFPADREDICFDPIIKLPISGNLNDFRFSVREDVWKPSWQKSKRDEGDDSSIQITHVLPLVEKEIRHISSNVRYGFRWTNVAMTDHSVEETVAFMERIVHANGE